MFGTLTGLGGGLFDDLGRLQRELDEAFGRWPLPAEIRSPARGSYPPINVGATGDRVEVYLFAAGLDTGSLDISIQQNLLTVAGQRKVEPREGAGYYRSERFSGDFRRVITLPDDVDPDRVDARYRDGVLQISVHRREAARPRRIQVN
jgi:HSP20 family protein